MSSPTSLHTQYGTLQYYLKYHSAKIWTYTMAAPIWYMMPIEVIEQMNSFPTSIASPVYQPKVHSNSRRPDWTRTLSSEEKSRKLPAVSMGTLTTQNYLPSGGQRCQSLQNSVALHSLAELVFYSSDPVVQLIDVILL